MKRAVPAKGLTFSCICLLGGVVMLYVNPSVIGAFTMITTVSAILFMFVWTIILCSYLAYRKQCPHLHEKSIYKMPLGKLMCWVCMAFFVFVIVLLTLEDDTRQALLVTPLWFIALGLGWLLIQKTHGEVMPLRHLRVSFRLQNCLMRYAYQALYYPSSAEKIGQFSLPAVRMPYRALGSNLLRRFMQRTAFLPK